MRLWRERSLSGRLRDARSRARQQSTAAIYFDDQLSGNVVHGNVFVDVNLGVLLGGGRHHQVYNNTFVRCDSAVHLDDRGLTWQKQYCQSRPSSPPRLPTPAVALSTRDSPCRACPSGAVSSYPLLL